MFNLGPFEIAVLLVVALVVFGPDKLPTLAKDAARMLKTLRDLTQNARTQLTDELGPEFRDLDLSSLNPRTAITRALLNDSSSEDEARSGVDLSKDESADKPVSRPAAPPLRRDESAPYDLDAT